MGQRRDRESKAARAARRSARAPHVPADPFKGLGPRAVPDQEFQDAIRAVNTIRDFIAMQKRRKADVLNPDTPPAIAGALLEDIETRLLGKPNARLEVAGQLALSAVGTLDVYVHAPEENPE